MHLTSGIFYGIPQHEKGCIPTVPTVPILYHAIENKIANTTNAVHDRDGKFGPQCNTLNSLHGMIKAL